MTLALLQVEGASVTFGGVAALRDVSFEVGTGDLVGLIGPNGAGKTTTMRGISGVAPLDAGQIRLNGLDIGGLSVHRRVRAGLAVSQQLVRPFRALSLLDNVALAAGTAKTANPLTALFTHDRQAERARARELLDLVGIGDAADAQPATQPLGYLKRLEVARALALAPKLLLLDEPLAGLNHVEAGRLADTILELNRQGITILLIEHNLSEVLRICDKLVVLDNGRRIATGRPAEVMADPRVRLAYLGEAHASA